MLSFDTKNADDMSYMFLGCNSLNFQALFTSEYKEVINNKKKLSIFYNFKKYELLSEHTMHNLFFNIIIVGDSSLSGGKTQFVSRASSQKLSYSNYIDRCNYNIRYDKKIITLHIVDYNYSQEIYNNLYSYFFLNSSLVIIYYPINNIISYNKSEDWFNICRKYCNPDTKLFLLGNTLDIPEKE